MVPFTSVKIEAVDKRLNREGGYWRQIPVKYRFYGQDKIAQWLTKKLETVKKARM